MLAAEKCVRTFADRAVVHGASLHQNEQVTEIAPQPTGVRVTTQAGHYEADSVVLCAGSWSLPMLNALELIFICRFRASRWCSLPQKSGGLQYWAVSIGFAALCR